LTQEVGVNIYNIMSLSLAAILYVYLARQIRKGTAEQNLATWLSWGLLDTVAGVSLFAQHGNWYLLSVYVASCIMIICCIIGSAKFTWGKVETICFLLVVVSIVIWTQSGAWYATIISTFGVAVATYPQIKDAVLRPKTAPAEVYLGFVAVNALATLAGKGWTIEERLYPAVCTVLCILIVGPASRKYFTRPRPL
jgi:Zn-dependent protease with chaperone function